MIFRPSLHLWHLILFFFVFYAEIIINIIAAINAILTPSTYFNLRELKEFSLSWPAKHPNKSYRESFCWIRSLIWFEPFVSLQERIHYKSTRLLIDQLYHKTFLFWVSGVLQDITATANWAGRLTEWCGEENNIRPNLQKLVLKAIQCL